MLHFLSTPEKGCINTGQIFHTLPNAITSHHNHDHRNHNPRFICLPVHDSVFFFENDFKMSSFPIQIVTSCRAVHPLSPAAVRFTLSPISTRHRQRFRWMNLDTYVRGMNEFSLHKHLLSITHWNDEDWHFDSSQQTMISTTIKIWLRNNPTRNEVKIIRSGGRNAERVLS